jgi:hypothetical protein
LRIAVAASTTSSMGNDSFAGTPRVKLMVEDMADDYPTLAVID